MVTHKLSVPTMKCGGCVSTVEAALTNLSNVQNVEVDLENKTVAIKTNAEIEVNQLIAAVTNSGFAAVMV